MALLSFFVVACSSTNKVLEQADLEMQRGNLDTAIAYYQQILLEDPDNTQAKISMAHAKIDASQLHEQQGVEYVEAGQLEEAVLELQLAVRLDTGNEVAIQELAKAQQALTDQRLSEDEAQTSVERAIAGSPGAASVLPKLQPSTTGPISFDFRAVDIFEIYRTLGQLGGINVLFEPSLSSVETSFQVDAEDFESALRLLTMSHGHFYKVLGPTTVLVIPDDVTMRREYADQVMRTFYLSNADAVTVEQQIRAILTSRLITSNPDLNTITIRDTPEAVDVAERFILASDKAVGEIMLEVEVLEVSSEVVSNYGLALEPFSGLFQLPPVTSEDGNVLGRSLEKMGNLTSADIFVTIPTLFYQFLRTTNDFKLVAQPKLRATEGQATTLLIGEQVPVVTTTFNPQSTVGGNVVPVSSTEYRDTGILMTVTPRVHFNREITLDIEIQVSAVTATATIASVGDLPVFTTRQVAGSIRLRDGQTNVIAGLLQDQSIRSRRGIIGVDNIPVVGDALSNTQGTSDQTDVVISITPHLLRAADITADDLRPTYVGTESSIVGAGGSLGARGGPPGAAQQAGAASVLAMLPAQHVVQPEEEFAIDLTIDGVEDLFSAGLALRYDPNVIAYVEAFEGGFLDRDGVETTMQVTNGGDGVVRMGMSRMSSEVGVSGSGSLVTLVFRGVAEGSTTIDISAQSLRGPQGAPLAVQMLPAQVQVSQRRDD